MSTDDKTVFDLPNSPDEFQLDITQASLRDIKYTALEFDTLRRIAVEYVRTYFPDQFNDFVEDNGFVMVLELLSYLSSILALREDVIANEAFLPTSRTSTAVDQHLNLINERIKPQTPASVPVVCSLQQPLISDMLIPAGTSFDLPSPDGNVLTYEIFKSPGDFSSDIVIPKGKVGVTAFGIEGSFAEPFTIVSDGSKNLVITVNDVNILDAPIIVEVSSGDVVESWKRIDVIERAGPGEQLYEARVLENEMKIVFGNGEYGSVPDSGSTITIRYRVGGGVRGRIKSGFINDQISLAPQPPLSAPVNVSFRNMQPSEGGFDRETVERAKRRAPIEASAHDSIVTSEDYAIKAQSYSHPVYGAVLKAGAIIRTSINVNRVELYVLAAGADGQPVKPSLGLKTGLSNSLSDINVLTDEVVVMDGSVKQIDLKMDVVIDKNFDIPTVRKNVESQVDEFFDIDNFEVGNGFKLSNLYSSIESVDGVKFVKIFKPSDDILESDEKTTEVGSLLVGYSEVITLGARDITYYLEAGSQQRLSS